MQGIRVNCARGASRAGAGKLKFTCLCRQAACNAAKLRVEPFAGNFARASLTKYHLVFYKSCILNLFEKSESRYEKSHANLLINLWRVSDCQFTRVPGNGKYYTSSGSHPRVSTVKFNSQNILFRSDTISKEKQYSLLFRTLWASHNSSSVPSTWRANWHICYFKPRLVNLSIAAKKSFWIVSLTPSTTLPTSLVILLVKLPSNVRTSRAF